MIEVGPFPGWATVPEWQPWPVRDSVCMYWGSSGTGGATVAKGRGATLLVLRPHTDDLHRVDLLKDLETRPRDLVLAQVGSLLATVHSHGSQEYIVRLDATGDITPPDISTTNHAVVWCHPRKGNYLQTPIVVGDLLWGCSNDGIVTCFDAKTGRINYEERIGGGGQGFTASPVAAKGKLYFTGELGDVFVLPASEQFRVLATYKLGGICLATPAISEGTLFFRTTERLLAVGARR